MKKHFLKYILFIIIFLILPVTVNASFGDLRYEITNVGISGSEITFEGYAFIHRTNNFHTITYNGNTIASDGGQKIMMRAINFDTKEIIAEEAYVTQNDPINKSYNFYCELFHRSGGRDCTLDNYISYGKTKPTGGANAINSCVNDSDGSGSSGLDQYCYYEDIAFTIKFDTSKWNVSSDTSIFFQIAATNNDFEKKINNPGSNSYYINYVASKGEDGRLYSKPEDVFISKSLVSKMETDFIAIDAESFSNQIFDIATDSILRYYDGYSLLSFRNRIGKHIYAISPSQSRSGCLNKYYLAEDYRDDYPGGISTFYSTEQCAWFLKNCIGSRNYAIYVKNLDAKISAGGGAICPSNPYDNTADDGVLIAYGSHVKLTGSTVFQINVKNKKLCEIDNPKENGRSLVCNDSKTLNSTCEELSVDTNKGRATVKIEQKGTISSVLTPDKIYAGGGFNFGVMYYNTIKWSYVGSRPNNELHNAVVEEMNKKLKSYDSYIAGLNITELKLGDKKFSTYDASFLNKLCTTSDRNNDYYDKELTVSCVFSFPESILYPDGTVKYNTGVGNFNINNKYYTNINYDSNYDKYKLEANIVGMDRITENAAKNDSAEEGKAWTGDWSDTFTNCEIDLYPLLMKDSRYNFIYRPIDISNPFPSRNAGINWYDWYNDNYNKSLLENTYSDLEYTVILGNQSISEIKEYNNDLNNSGGYLNWDSIDTDGKSSFVDEYVTREEGVR